MKKRIIAILILTVTSLCQLMAFDNYFTLNFEYSYDTNIFSDPLPQFDPTYDWLTWRESNPFVKKSSLGFNISYDGFSGEKSRTGISAALSAKFPVSASYFTPHPFYPDNGPLHGWHSGWDYFETDELEKQTPAIFGSIGPIFRAQFGFADLGIAIRLSLGAYFLDDYELVMGIQAEPYFNVFVGDNMYISLKFTYDGHLMKFINDEEKIFDSYYQMLTIAPSIGIGIKF